MPISHIASQEEALQPSQEVKASQEFRALHSYMHNKTESASHAQDEFCKTVENSFMSDQDPQAIEGHLWNAWRAVTGLAATTHGGVSHQQRLVDFVLGLQTRPVVEKGGKVCKVWDAVVWSELPVFGAQIRETYNFAPQPDSKADAKTQWLNLNTFLTLLVETAQSRKVSGVDFSLYAIWAIRSGLEESGEPSEIAVETATIWLRYAASAIYALTVEEKKFDGKVAAPGSGFPQEAWTGFSKDRWRAWSSRLSQIQDEGSSKQCEQSVAAARQAMGEYLER